MSQLTPDMLENSAGAAALAEHMETPATTSVEIPAAEEAAMKYTKLLPFATKLANALPSKGAVVRIVTAMAEFPIGGRQPRLLSEAERQLFAVLQELNGYKSKVLQSFIEKQNELKQTAAELPVAEEVINGRE